jgi:hypothetical protein
MQAPEHPPHQLRIGAILVQLQQSRLQIHKNIARFLTEAVPELIDAAYG